MSRTRHMLALALSATFVLGTVASADQMICIAATDFIVASSDLGDIGGNIWQEIADTDGLRGVSMVAPGPGSTDGAVARPWLVYELPVDVQAGESTSDGKTWQIWHHLRVVTDSNSFYWQLSSDGAAWRRTWTWTSSTAPCSPASLTRCPLCSEAGTRAYWLGLGLGLGLGGVY